MAVVDAQFVQCSKRGVRYKGFDGHKQVQDRKPQMVVDTDGYLIAAHIIAAHIGPDNANDQTGGRAVLEKLHHQGFACL